MKKSIAVKWFGVVLIATGVMMISTLAASANVLVNPGFEADAVSGEAPVGGASGWDTPGGNAFTASDPISPVRTGIGSLQLTAGGGFSVPVAFQTFPASPGQIWDFQGHMLTESFLPADATFGLLKIVWSDGAGDLPVGAADVLIGQPGPVANPGVEALPFVDASSIPGAWHFAQARGIAPAGTTEVSFFAILVDESGGTVYFDDLSAMIIPEPSTLTIAGLSLAMLMGWRRRSGA